MDKNMNSLSSIDTVKPIMLACLGYALFNLTDASIKFVSAEVHTSLILLIAYSVQFLLVVIYGLLFTKGQGFKTKQLKLLIIRSTISSIAVLINVTAIPNVTLANFYTVIFTAPIWVAILSAYVLKDKIGKNRIIAITLGVAAILFMFRPNSQIFSIWSIMLLCGAFITAIDLLLIRKIGKAESRVTLVAMGCFVAIILNAPLAIANYTPVSLQSFAIISVGSLVSMSGFLAVAFAYQTATSAVLVAPFHYSQIIWGSILGYFIFNEVPTHTTIIGAFMIIASGIYLIISENKINRKAREQQVARATVY